MTPAFKEYSYELVDLAARHHGLRTGPVTTFEAYQREFRDATREGYWAEVVEGLVLKIPALYEKAWDPDTQTLKEDTDFSEFLVAPDDVDGFPKEWSSGSLADKNRSALENANRILISKKPGGMNVLRRLKSKVIVEWYAKAPSGQKCETVCKKLDERLGDKILAIDPTLEDWMELSYSGALKNQPKKVRPWLSITYKRLIRT